jgi:hypothetical protein
MGRVRAAWEGLGPQEQHPWRRRDYEGDGAWELVPELALAVGPSCLGVGRGVVNLGHRSKGERLGEYVGERVLLREVDVPGAYLVQCRPGGWYGIDGGEGGDWTALVQHAFKGQGANLAMRWEHHRSSTQYSRAFLEAIRDIPPGEELCWEYGVKDTLWFPGTLRPWVPVEDQLAGKW